MLRSGGLRHHAYSCFTSPKWPWKTHQLHVVCNRRRSSTQKTQSYDKGLTICDRRCHAPGHMSYDFISRCGDDDSPGNIRHVELSDILEKDITFRHSIRKI
jgi:hypothetical protein